jgi:hypothetical protein
VKRVDVFLFILPLFLRVSFTPNDLIDSNLGSDLDNSVEQGRRTFER